LSPGIFIFALLNGKNMPGRLDWICCFSICLICLGSVHAQQEMSTDVLVIGGGTGGTAAALQSARSGAKTLLIESTNMLGGMLTAAGVSCTDGNDSLPSGIWQSFRDALHAHYKTKNLASGWVSETCFEPHVGDSIFKAWASKEQRLTIKYNWHFISVKKKGNKITGAMFSNSKKEQLIVNFTLCIDASELGDVLAGAGAGYDIGTEDASYAKEKMAPGKTDIIQDLTWTAVLKDFGPSSNKIIAKPTGYDAKKYYCCCTSAPCNGMAYKADAKSMLDYGQLPGRKYMINWPAHGNDSYLNVIESSLPERQIAYEKAKLNTLGFIYFIQTELGFNHLGLADDELSGGLGLIPYNREGRRVKGLVRMNVNHITDPFDQPEKLYRTGIAVGDYPVDHHHGQNPLTPAIAFPRIPSFNIPLGSLIPEGLDGLIVCEKGISVSNIVNGASRLQPIVLLTGQAAGMLAAICIREQKEPALINPRIVQQALLDAGCYLMPYVDVQPDNPHWASIQRVGSTGILRGTGKPQGWANKTLFYPDSSVSKAFLKDIYSYDHSTYFLLEDSVITIDDAFSILSSYMKASVNKDSVQVVEDDMELVKGIWISLGLEDFDPSRPIKRWEMAVLLDKYYNVFTRKKMDMKGNWIE
jgi:hypothetical protein